MNLINLLVFGTPGLYFLALSIALIAGWFSSRLTAVCVALSLFSGLYAFDRSMIWMGSFSFLRPLGYGVAVFAIVVFYVKGWDRLPWRPTKILGWISMLFFLVIAGFSARSAYRSFTRPTEAEMSFGRPMKGQSEAEWMTNKVEPLKKGCDTGDAEDCIAVARVLRGEPGTEYTRKGCELKNQEACIMLVTHYWLEKNEVEHKKALDLLCKKMDPDTCKLISDMRKFKKD